MREGKEMNMKEEQACTHLTGLINTKQIRVRCSSAEYDKTESRQDRQDVTRCN
jgi:hypothetical protein